VKSVIRHFLTINGVRYEHIAKDGTALRMVTRTVQGTVPPMHLRETSNAIC
jgi:hypothetical protein